MEKIFNFIIVTVLAITFTYVCGNNDETPLKEMIGFPLWRPLTTWRRQLYPPADSYQHNTEDEIDDYPSALAGDTDFTAQNFHTIDFKLKRTRPRHPICESLINVVYVGNNSDGYQYRPDHYITESCLNSYNTYQNRCSETGLSCTQIKQKMFITRRKAGDDAKAINCWEHVRMEEYDAGCECMYPKEHIVDKHSQRNGK
ncbi:uncharacterized protein LOC110676394 [Aedes aegypti]|uniref:Uncharacterized protein n=1 Tax=Aedes aegypti TaxID=7159 RepID=A0A6I8U131_AEDAE|nr:uncharacterized protein LOC110676394 [Aedes aegypti]